MTTIFSRPKKGPIPPVVPMSPEERARLKALYDENVRLGNNDWDDSFELE